MIHKLFRWLTNRGEKPPMFTGDEEVLERYRDFTPIGNWAVVNTETGETEQEGTMYSETVKFRDSKGAVHIAHDWVDKSE